MNLCETIQASVFDSVVGPLNGRPATYITLDSIGSPTLSRSIGTTDTTISISASNALTQAYLIKIDFEIMEVTAGFSAMISVTTLTVTRGAKGTTAANHTSGAAISFAGYDVDLVIDPTAWNSYFDTGSTDIDYNMLAVKIGVNQIPNAPVEQARATNQGDSFILDDLPNETWYVREKLNDGEHACGYHEMNVSDYQGPLGM